LSRFFNGFRVLGEHLIRLEQPLQGHRALDDLQKFLDLVNKGRSPTYAGTTGSLGLTITNAGQEPPKASFGQTALTYPATNPCRPPLLRRPPKRSRISPIET
jgi:hypothetical protein